MTTDFRSVAAVVVHYDSTATLLRTVDNLGKHLTAEQIVVVDNSSSLSPGQFPSGMKLLNDGQNRGYAGGVNHGIRFISQHIPDASEILVCTHEALFREGSLETLLATASGYPRGHVVGPKLVTFDADGNEVVWSNGGTYSFPFLYPKHGRAGATAGTRTVKWVDGAAFLMDLTSWAKVGGIPEEFFMYMEDVALGELCRQHRIPVVVNLDAVVEQTANGPSRALAIRNRVLLALRYMSFPSRGVVRLEVFARQCLMAIHPDRRIRLKASESRVATREARVIAKTRRASWTSEPPAS